MKPVLRFSEFEDDWSHRRLSDVCEKIQDGNYGGEYPKAEEFVVSGVPFLTSKAIGGDGSLIEEKVKFITPKKHSSLKKAQLSFHDVLFTNRGSNVGMIGFVDERVENGNIGPQLTLLRANKSFIVPEFLRELMKSFPVVKQIRSQDSGSAMNFFGIGATSKFRFNIPCLKEQQIIADSLSSVDEKISLLKQKHILLKEYKKGVIQQLLSQQIRFKDESGKYFPNWQEVQLQDIATPIKRKAENAIENVMTISAGRGFLHQTERFSQVIAGTSLNKYTLIKRNEFSYNRGNSKSYTYGCIYKLEDHDEALVPFVYRSFSLDKGVPAFYECLFEHKYLDRQLRRLISSSARMDGLLNIGEKEFYKVKLPYPCEQEQIKITEFVAVINKKIKFAAEQIERTQTFKKGLLQQMFV